MGYSGGRNLHMEVNVMRAFIAAVVMAAVITAAAAFLLEQFQAGSDVANTTTGTRITIEKETH